MCGYSVIFVAKIGDHVLARWAVVRDIAAVAWAVIVLSCKPSTWRPPVRAQLGRQILFTGVEAVWVVVAIAVLAGVSVVVQTQLWLTRFGQTELLGAILVATIIRELGPLFVNFVVIGRSGTAISTELANMRVLREVELLDAQGVEPMIYLIVPRVLGMTISVLCLTVVFIIVSLISGYLFGFMLNIASRNPAAFLNAVFQSVTPSDIINLIAKTLIPGMTTGIICSLEGISIRGLITEVPQATTRGVVRSIIALLLISAIVSVFTYVR